MASPFPLLAEVCLFLYNKICSIYTPSSKFPAPLCLPLCAGRSPRAFFGGLILVSGISHAVASTFTYSPLPGTSNTGPGQRHQYPSTRTLLVPYLRRFIHSILPSLLHAHGCRLASRRHLLPPARVAPVSANFVKKSISRTKIIRGGATKIYTERI